MAPSPASTSSTTSAPPASTAAPTPAPTPIPRTDARCAAPPPASNTPTAHVPLFLQNVTIVDGNGILAEQDILIVDGRISAVTPTHTTSPGVAPTDVGGAYVTAGLVDMHSHVGVYAFPDTFGTSDGNEMTNPTTPFVRVVDAYNAHDPAIDDVVAGGITTIQVLPGSGNAMGGQGALFKAWPRRSGRANILRAHVNTSFVTLKMACGENPKRVYGAKGRTPMSRMGSAYVMRAQLFAARALLAQRQQWCAGYGDANAPFPDSLELAPLVSLLQGQAVLNVHCYKTVDFEMMLRVADEFGVAVNSFHHAHEAYELAPRLAERHITAALFADNYGYKMEALEGSVFAPRILAENGVPVAIKSDHPVTDAGLLATQAAVAAHYGLGSERAIAAVTSVPAAAIGLGASVGALRVGFDGDVAVWDRHPLLVGARPTRVYIEGTLVYQNANAAAETPASLPRAPRAAALNASTWLPSATLAALCESTAGAPPPAPLVVRGATLFAMQRADTGGVDPADGSVGTLAIDASGNVVCIERSAIGCATFASLPQALVVTVNSSYYLVPTFINGDPNAQLGDEVASEETGRDGVASADGIADRFGLGPLSTHGSTRLAQGLFADGIGLAIRAPAASGVRNGVAFVVRTGDGWYGAELAADGSGVVVARNVALVASIGYAQRQDGEASGALSGQLEQLVELLANRSATAGSGVLAVTVDSADDILAVLALTRSLAWPGSVAIVGGAEASVVATQLAAANATVVLSKPQCMRDRLDRMRCDRTRVATLRAAGVRVLFADSELATLRGLRFRVGHEWQRNRIAEHDALASITSNVATTYALPAGFGELRVGGVARFTLFDAHPLLYGSSVALVVDRLRRRCAPSPDGPYVGFENY